MDTKQSKYRNLIERVKASYPARNPSDDGKELRLYWCDNCKEIKSSRNLIIIVATSRSCFCLHYTGILS